MTIPRNYVDYVATEYGVARLKGCKVVYNVQEIYPDILKLKGGVALKVLRWMERKVYMGSDAVTTIDKVFYDTIVGRFEKPSRLHIIPNFVDTELYHEIPGSRFKVQGSRLIQDTNTNLSNDTNTIKLLYAGNIGHAQSWEPLIELADRMRGLDVEYFVIGEGAKREYVAAEKERRGLEKHWGEPFVEERWQRLVSRVCFHKLTYMPDKVPAKVAGTYYEQILKAN